MLQRDEFECFLAIKQFAMSAGPFTSALSEKKLCFRQKSFQPRKYHVSNTTNSLNLFETLCDENQIHAKPVIALQ